jgi:cholesterol oxidase
VCVLERGQAYPPNSFARSPYAFDRNFWDPPAGHFGLFNAWSFDHMDAIVSAGLGGGSLIYANVLIRKDEHWFVFNDGSGPRPWPLTRADLDPHYAAAEKMLDGQVFPMSEPPYNEVRKAAEFKRAALNLGFAETTYDRINPQDREWYLPLLAVTFANRGRPPIPGEHIVEEVRNLHDRDRQTCRLCGECDIGCNYGAKNTLDYNYLTHAKAQGADIRTLAEVKTFRPRPGGEGFEVEYVDHGLMGADGAAGVTRTVSGRHIVLSAGTLGSTYLLLKHRGAFPQLSPVLGHRFSGNGDLLTMAIDAHLGSPDGERPRVIDPSHGPVITGTLRSPDALDGAPEGSLGFYLQDAGYPVFVDWLVQVANVRSDIRGLLGFVLHRVRADLFHRGGADLDATLERVLSDTGLSAGSMPLLGMGLDIPDGVFGLDGEGRLALNWDKRRSQPFYDGVLSVSREIAEDELNATFVENPLTQFLSRLITVHPLGGCPMGNTPEEGVVDAWGRVHGVPGLHVADGSVMPGPVGPNPSLTIAALADRFADQMLEDLDAARVG